MSNDDEDRVVHAFFRAETPAAIAVACEDARRSVRHVVIEPPIRHPLTGDPLPLVPLVGGDAARAGVEREIEDIVGRRTMYSVHLDEETIAEMTAEIEGAVRRLFAGLPGGPWSRWQLPLMSSKVEGREPEDMSSHRMTDPPDTICWAGKEALLLDVGDRLVLLSSVDGSVARVFPSRGAYLLGVIDGQAILRGEIAGPVFDASDLARDANRAIQEHTQLEVDLEAPLPAAVLDPLS